MYYRLLIEGIPESKWNSILNMVTVSNIGKSVKYHNRSVKVNIKVLDGNEIVDNGFKNLPLSEKKYLLSKCKFGVYEGYF